MKDGIMMNFTTLAIVVSLHVSISLFMRDNGVVHGFSIPSESSRRGESRSRESPLVKIIRPRHNPVLSTQTTDNYYDSSSIIFHHVEHDGIKHHTKKSKSTTTTYSKENIACLNRQHFLHAAASRLQLVLLPIFTLCSTPNPSYALVKGNAPPPKMKPPSSSSSSFTNGDNTTDGIKKCRNVEECQEMAERAEVAYLQREAEKAASGPKPQMVNGRTRYLDIITTDDNDTTGNAATKRVAQIGNTITIHYKVLKLGKRSYDGLSGEGTVVFSRGYALEDDEKVPGDKSFTFVLGNTRVIQALNDAIPGMVLGSTRRISVTPQSGWEKNIPSCDGGPGGRGIGGELRTDYVVVPTATMVEQEACFDRTKLPFPSTYAQERRMAQRFDQSLIIEVQLVNVVPS